MGAAESAGREGLTERRLSGTRSRERECREGRSGGRGCDLDWVSVSAGATTADDVEG